MQQFIIHFEDARRKVSTRAYLFNFLILFILMCSFHIIKPFHIHRRQTTETFDKFIKKSSRKLCNAIKEI